MSEHPLLFPSFEKREKVLPTYAQWRRAGEPYTDSWCCTWQTAGNGITGAVVKHALEDWAAFPSYVPPSPEEHDGWGPIGWDEIRKGIATAREKGRLAAGSLRHGHTFLTLTYLRGY